MIKNFSFSNFNYLLIFISFFLSLQANGQNIQQATVSGKVVSAANGEALIGANILLVNRNDSNLSYGAATNLSGNFNFSNINQGNYRMRVTYIGYLTLDTVVNINSQNHIIGTIALLPSADMLEEVLVRGTQIRERQIGDTTEYNADAFQTNPDASAEDMVRKMPGITVEGGRVQAQGEDVRRVLVDGQEFFGDDATTALRNLPAEMIERIQVFDRQSDQARFTGIDDGDGERTINIVTRPGMNNGQFGKVFAGYGLDNRYVAGGNTNIFQGQRRISIIGLSNNINQQNFSTEDLAGVVSPQTGGRAGGSRGGRGGGRQAGGGDAGNFLIGQQAGISTINSIGLNYTDRWGERINITGSYFFNHTNNRNQAFLTRDFFSGEGEGQLYTEDMDNESLNMNHRINFRMTYEIDSFNSIVLTPRISFQESETERVFSGSNSMFNSLVSETFSSQNSGNSAFNFNNTILYRHRTRTPRRTFSVSVTNGINNREGESFLNSRNWFASDPDTLFLIDQTALSNSLRYSNSANFSYTEPLSERSTLQLNYRPSVSTSNSERETFNLNGEQEMIPDTLLTNVFENRYTTHRAGLNYLFRDSLYNLTIGAEYQHASLQGQQFFPYNREISHTFQNILPSLRYQYRFSRNSNLNIMYRTRTAEPNINQLQNVIDNSNQLLLTIGNPELQQSYSHFVVSRFGRTNPENSRSVFAFLTAGATQNYIGNSTFIARQDTLLDEGVLLQQGAQLSRPANLDGHYTIRSFFTYALPSQMLRSNLSFNAGASYSRTPSMLNNIRNFSHNTGINTGFVAASNISQNIDFTLTYSANYTFVENEVRPELGNNYFNQNTGARLNLILGNRFVVNTDANHMLFRGLGEGFNQSYLLWNAGAGVKFLKNNAGELRLNVFDLLNNNKNINREITDTFIEDSQTNVLNRYGLLTFTYTFRNYNALNRIRE